MPRFTRSIPSDQAHTTMSRSILRSVGLGVAAIASALTLSSPAANAAVTAEELSKPILLITGPEVIKDACTAMAPYATAIRAYRPVDAEGQKVTNSGKLRYIAVNPKGSTCNRDDAMRVDGSTLGDAALALAKEIERVNAESKQAVDVVAAGSAGLTLRYALLMSQRKRLGQTALGGADRYPSVLKVQDAVTLSTPHDGMTAASSGCGSTTFCNDLTKDAEKPALHWQLLATAEGMNPQGVGGTDWSAFAFGADRFVPASSATGMDARHKTIYVDDQQTFIKGLADSSDKSDAKLRFSHGGAEYRLANKGLHVVQRAAVDLVWGLSYDGAGEGPAFADGCVGFNDSGAGETVVTDPAMVGWKGDKNAVRVVKAGVIDAASNCFVADGKDVFTVRTPNAVVRVNGLDYVLSPLGDAKLSIDVKKRRLWRAGGSIQVRLPVSEGISVPLWTFNTSTAAIKDLDFRFPSSDGALQTEDGTPYTVNSPEFELFGLKAKGAIALKLVKGATQLDTSLALPGYFSSRLTGTSMVQCSDGIDNDKDGRSDIEDPDCNNDLSGDFEDRSQASGLGIVIATNNKQGLTVDKFNVGFGGSIRFGPFRSEGAVGFEYSVATKEWKATIEAKVPSMSNIGIKLKVGFRGLQMTSIYGEANGLNVPLWSSGFFLQRFGLGANGLGEGQQREILIGVAVSFFRKVAQRTLVLVDGDLTVGWGAPWKAKLEGSLKVADVTLGTGSFEYEDGAGVKIGAKLGREIPLNGGKAKLTPTGTLVGQASNAGEFELGASVQLCLKGELKWRTFDDPFCAGKADMRLTKYAGQPLTQVYCLKTNFTGGFVDFNIGFVTTYDITEQGFRSTIEWISNSCDVADYGSKPSQTVGAPRTDAFTVRPGSGAAGVGDQQVVTVRGVGGEAPRVTLVSPSGQRYETPDTQMAKQFDDVFVITGMGDRTAFALAKPTVGEWKVEVAEGSPAVASIDTAEVLPAPEVRGSVKRAAGGRFALSYDVREQPGQTVRFYERGGAVLAKVAERRGGKGVQTFTPAFAATAARREIVAVVFQDGRRRTEQVVATYRAPAAAKPAKVRGVKLKRSGRKLVITWDRAPRATGGYAVEAQLPDGRSWSKIVRGGKRRVTIGSIDVPGKSTVTVRGVRKQDEAAGAPRTVRGGA